MGLLWLRPKRADTTDGLNTDVSRLKICSWQLVDNTILIRFDSETRVPALINYFENSQFQMICFTCGNRYYSQPFALQICSSNHLFVLLQVSQKV